MRWTSATVATSSARRASFGHGAGVEPAHDLLHHRDGASHARELADPHADQDGHGQRIARHLAAHRDRNAGPARSPGGAIEQGQHAWVQGVVEVGDPLVAAVDRKRVLGEIVGARC